MLLAEDLLLLVTNDASGRLSVPSSQADAGLGGANMLELTLLGKVDISGPEDPGRAGRLIVQALVQPGVPDERTAALIALLHALKCEHKVVDPASCGLSRRQLRARAGEIAQGNWASDAVRKAIDEMVAAVAAASAAAAAASSG